MRAHCASCGSQVLKELNSVEPSLKLYWAHCKKKPSALKLRSTTCPAKINLNSGKKYRCVMERQSRHISLIESPFSRWRLELKVCRCGYYGNDRDEAETLLNSPLTQKR